MPLTLIGKTLLIQIRPSGARDSIDLDKILSNFDGTFALVGDGKGKFSRSASNVRLEGSQLVAFLSRSNKTCIEVSVDLEKFGIVTDHGLCLPPSIRDPALQTSLPFAKRAGLAHGRPTRRLRLALGDYEKTNSSKSAWRMANASEQRCLYFLAKAERELLRVAGKKCTYARIMPGWIDGDSCKLSCNPRIDKLGLLRDFNCLVREETGSAPIDYAACFELARKIVWDRYKSYPTNSSSGFFECHIRDAETHLRRSLAVRQEVLKREAFGFLDFDCSTRDGRKDFWDRLELVADDLTNLISSQSPTNPIPSPTTAQAPSSIIQRAMGKVPSRLEGIEEMEVDDDYDLEESNEADRKGGNANPFRN